MDRVPAYYIDVQLLSFVFLVLHNSPPLCLLYHHHPAVISPTIRRPSVTYIVVHILSTHLMFRGLWSVMYVGGLAYEYMHAGNLATTFSSDEQIPTGSWCGGERNFIYYALTRGRAYSDVNGRVQAQPQANA